jgi:hypothetical protein
MMSSTFPGDFSKNFAEVLHSQEIEKFGAGLWKHYPLLAKFGPEGLMFVTIEFIC